MESKKEFDWAHYDWSKLKENYNENVCPSKKISLENVKEGQVLNRKHSYFCTYDEYNYTCGCHPKEYNFPKLEKDQTFNVLFIAKLGDVDVFPIIYAMIQMIMQVKNSNPVFYGSEQVIKEVNQINGEAPSILITCMNMPKPKHIEKEQLKVFDHKEHEKKINIIITIGGDGTILYAMRFFQSQNPPPIMCFEKGTLGFMAKNSLKNVIRDMGYVFYNMIQNKPIQVEEKMRLQGIISTKEGSECVHKFQYHALNEIVIERGSYSSVLKVDIFANEVFLTSLWGDGLIISTPTGSTAYNLSAGGPIVQNEVQGITITPICPFSLSFRPLVLPRCTQLKLVLTEDARGHGQICCDGQATHEFKQCDQIIIQESQMSLQQIRSSENFFEDWTDKLKRLLNWNNTNFNKEKKD